MAESVLWVARVYRWRDIRDSSNRISASEENTGRDFILNTNRISEVVAATDPNHPEIKSKFFYSDNPNSSREGLSEVWTSHTVAEITAHFDETPASQAITLPICPYNSPYKGNPVFPLRTPIDTTIGIWSIAYIDRYNPDPTNYVWCCYYRGGFKRLEVLTSLDDSNYYPTLTTTTTSTTTEQR